MPDIGIFTTNASIQARAGIGANATEKAVAATDVYVLNVEAQINIDSGKVWTAAIFAALNAGVAGLLTEAGACMCAINVIAQDTTGYSSIEEATFLADTLWSRYNKAMASLKDDNVKTFMEQA